jgi:hypothetical protein
MTLKTDPRGNAKPKAYSRLRIIINYGMRKGVT